MVVHLAKYGRGRASHLPAVPPAACPVARIDEKNQIKIHCHNPGKQILGEDSIWTNSRCYLFGVGDIEHLHPHCIKEP